MNSHIELNLALILFLPWYAILGFVFWRFPSQPRTAARRGFDTASLLLAFILAIVSTQWGFYYATSSYGGVWKQVLATSVSYGVFLLVLSIATLVRQRFLRESNQNRS